MKAFLRCLMLVAALCVGWVTNAQTLGDYTFSTGVDATRWVTVTDSTNVLVNGTADSRYSSLQNIGFTFPFAASSFTQFSVNSDGNLRLGSTVTGTANYLTPFNSTNAIVNNPKINFLGCDGYYLDTIHYVFAQNTVDANNDSLLVVEFCLGTYTSATRDQKYKWQVHLYPNGNIEVVMAPLAPTTAPATANQKGLCFDASDGWVIASNNTATHFTAGSSTTWASGSWPAPNTYYAFTRPIITCPAPTAITMNSLTPTTAGITFTPAGTETAWHGYITPGIMGFNEIMLTDTTVNLMYLTPNTEYTVTVRTVCGVGDTSFPTSMTFHTPCNPIAVPYTENFDNITTSTTSATGAMPGCWIVGAKDAAMTAAQRPQVYYGSSNAHSGSYSLRLYYNCYTALPLFQTPVDSLMIKFWVKQTSSNYVVVVGVMDNPYNPSTFVPIDTINCASSSAYEYHEVMFNNYSGNGQYIAFHNITHPAASYFYSYNYIDDLEVVHLPSCMYPQNVAASGISSTGATISWTGNAPNFTVAYGTDTNNLSTVSSNTTSVTLTGLTPATDYFVKVKAVCGTDDESDFSSTVSFTTLCNPVTVPYYTDFDDITTSTTAATGEMPACWTIGAPDVAMTATQSPQVYYNSTNAHSGSYSLRMYYRGYVALPVFNTPVDSLIVKFWLKQTSAGYQLEVGVMSDPTDASTFVPIDTIDNASTGYEYREVMFNNYTGNGQFIAFHNITTTTYNYSYNYIDDLEVSLLPSCFIPQNVAASNVDAHSATVSWFDSENTGATYTVYDMSDTSVVTTGLTGNTYTVTGLTPNTAYTFGIVANCSATDVSSFATVSVHTSCAPETLPFTEDFSANLSSNICWRGATGTTAAQVFGGASLNLTSPNWTYVSSTRDGLEGGHYYKNVYGSSVKSWIITPAIDLSNVTSAQLSFDVALTDYYNAALPDLNGDTNTSQAFMVIVSADGGNTWSASNATVWQNGTGDYTYASLADTVYQNKVISLNQYVGDTIKIAFYCQSLWSGGDNDLHIDNIAVTGESQVEPECVATTWITGDSTGSSYYTPVNNYYGYTLSETIIEAAEVGGPMRIDTISFHYMYSSPMTNKTDVTIWLQPTTKSSFSSTSDIDLLDSSIAVQIFSDSMNFSYGWNDIVLPTPYVFDGTSNLMLIVDDNSDDYNSSSYKFSTTSCSDYKTIAWYSDGQNPDPVTGNNSLTGNTYSSSKSRYMYRVRMALKGCDLTTCHKPNDLAVSGVAPYSAVLTWSNNNSSTTTYTVINMADSTVVSSGVSAGSFTITGLTPETSYAYGVYANCAADDSSIVAIVTFATPATCVMPSNFAASNVTDNSVTLTWVDNSNSSATYTVYDMSDTSVLATGLTATTYTVNGLTDNTAYVYGLEANCSATDASAIATLSVRTLCIPEQIPFVEDFSATLSSDFCWRGATGITAAEVFNGTTLSLASPSQWVYSSSTSNGLEAGHYRVNIYGTTCKRWLITPAIDLSTATSAQLSFDVAFTAYSGTSAASGFESNSSQAFMVIVSADGGNTWLETNAVKWQNEGGQYTLSSIASTSYINQIINLNQYLGDTIKIAFYAQSTTSGGDNNLHIDNIAVTEAPNCAAVTSLTVNSVSATSVSMSWSDSENTGATYTVYDMNDTSVVATGLTGNAYTVTGLTPNTAYTFGIVANCSATDVSGFVTISTRTSCAPETLPFTEDFSANLSSNLCWRGATGTTAAQVFAGASLNLTTPNWTYASSTRDGIEAGHYYKNVYGSSVKSWIITPAIDLSTVTSAQLSFDVALTDYYNAALPDLNGDTNTSQAFMVIVSTDGGDTWSASNATVWQNGTGDYTYASLADTVYQNKVISLNQYVGDTIKIAFYCQSLWSGGDNDLHIDNIAVTEGGQVEPGCVATTWITGDSTGSSYYTPVNNYYNYTLSETIIEAAEIGGPMRIDTISFHYMYSSPMTNKTDVTIWLQPTTKSSFSSTSDIDLLDSSIAVQIFSDSMNFSYGWNDIVLPTPYVFDGTSNLMLIVDDNSYDYDGSSYKFSTTSCSEYKTIAWYSDGQNPDPVTGNNSLTGNTYSSSKSRYMYRVRMTLKGCDLTTCHKPNDLAVSGVTPYGATLSWSNNNSSTTTYTVINMVDSTVVSSGVSAGSFTITGLTPETSYAYGVYANCAADDSSIVATVTFATPATCVVPSSFACGNITSSSATLSWTDNSNTGATYTIFDMSDTSVVATGLTANTYTVTGLTPNTAYTFGIVANCSATDVSSIVTVSARTSCVPETLPFIEDFSANLSSNLCWRGATGTTAAQVFAGASLNLTTPNWTYASSTRDGLEGGHYYKNVYGSSIKSWIITPAIDLSTVTSAQLSFDVALTDWNNAALPDLNGDTNTSQAFMVIVSTDGGNTWSAANATVWQNGTGDYTYASLADTVYQNKVISLNQYVGDTIKIAFYCQSLWSGGDNDLHIDNIAVTEGGQVEPGCQVTIYAEDAYGDGWNGGTITIMQGTDTVGIYSMAGQGVSSTTIYDTVTFAVLPGVPITFEWAAGSWAEEVSFTIVDGGNAAVYSCTDGSTLSDAVFFTLNDACPSCSGIQDLAVSDITSNSIVLTWSSDNSSATYTVYNMSDTSVIASGLTTTTYTVTGLTAETNYLFGVAAVCSATDSSAISTINAFTGYCSPNPTSVDDSGITSVSFGGMTNTTHPTSAGYANYSTMSGSVPAGTTATVDITYATGFTYGTIIWVDWNSNLIFEGNEVVYAGVSTSANPTTLTATFNIPASTTLGSYRMRIVGADSYFDSYTGSIAAAADANPCASYSWGVAEDYTLIVTTMPECLAVNGLTATATYNSVTLNWTDTNNTGATYTVYDMSDTSVVATGITGTTYTATGLTPNTSYTFGVTANCSATESSTMVTVAIHTPCVAVAIPFYESFDTNSATLGCWSAYSMNTANSVGLSYFNTNGIALRFSSYYSASDYNQYAFSPVFNYTGTESTLDFSVQYATYGSSDHLYFGYITPTDTVWSTNYYTTSGQSDVQTYTASIPANATQIAFHYYGNYAYYAWVDSVSVTEPPAAITMTISSADTAMGTTNPAPGTYTYLVGDTVTVNAVPNTGYSFDYWVLSFGAITDTITLSTYTGVVPAFAAGANFSLVAHFTPAQFNVTMATSNATMGTTVPAPGTYSYTLGDTLTISAIPATNCHFVQWSDGDTNATRLVTVTEAVTYTAVFDYNPITVTLLNADSTMGTITPAPGIYTFHVGDTAVAQATPTTGYHFNQWMISMAGLTDSMSNNPVTMILPTYLAGASITMTATYAPNLYSIDVYANDNTLGTVTGTGQYAYNSYATITATPAEHCIFVQWNDGDTNAVRSVLVTGNASYTATFQAIPQHEVILTVVEPGYGTVTGAGLYYEGEEFTVTATPNEGYVFVGWAVEASGDFDWAIFSVNPTFTYTMGETDVHYWAIFEEERIPATLHVSFDSYVGTIFINDVETSDYEGFVGDTITLHAVANDGFRFVNWAGEGVENPTSATITYVILAAETEIEANFEQLEGIIDVDGNNITIYSANNNIIVRGAEQQTIRVFDVVGRLIAQRTNANDEETIAMTNTGVYLVKVGDAPARRVVVRR